MTVIRLFDRTVMIHSAIELEAKDLEWLKGLGSVSFIVAPNVFHCSDATWMAKHFPEAVLLVPAKKLRDFEQQNLNPKNLATDYPNIDEVKFFPMQGANIDETVLLHVPSKTLIFCDLVFHMHASFGWLEGLFMKWNKIGNGRFGPSRLTKLVFASDKTKLKQSYQTLMEQDFDRVIMSHGEVLETGGKFKLQQGVEEIFG